MVNYLKKLISSKASTPQNQQAREDQVKNSAGGFVFEVDVWTRLDRFLILGTEGGSYYASELALSTENAKAVDTCLTLDGARTVNRIVEISDKGRAPKNDPAIFALAMAAAHPDDNTRKLALAALPKVCRTGTHLLHFAEYVEGFRRWGRGLRRAVGNWYNTMPAEKVAFQVAKYAQRDGWSHRDLLRLAHPVGATPAHNAVYRWVTGGGAEALAKETKRGQSPNKNDLPEILVAFEQLKNAKKSKEVISLIRKHKLTHEMLPTEFKNDVAVWEALLEDMPITAMIRSLAKMTDVGLLKPLSTATRRVCDALADVKRLKQGRVHPIAVLAALKVYEQGHGERGSLKWTPVGQIVDALDSAFRLAFETVEPTGKKHFLALDVSGSMTWGNIAGMPGITPRIGSAAMSLITAGVEPNWEIMGFADKLVPINITPKMSLANVISTIERVPMGGTDCALPMLHAAKEKIEVDTFVVYTDSETWFGKVHPFEALKQYREKMGRPAKLIVVGMLANKFSIADPNDAGMLDVVGFDTAAPNVMASFSKE